MSLTARNRNVEDLFTNPQQQPIQQQNKYVISPAKENHGLRASHSKQFNSDLNNSGLKNLMKQKIEQQNGRDKER